MPASSNHFVQRRRLKGGGGQDGTGPSEFEVDGMDMVIPKAKLPQLGHTTGRNSYWPASVA